MKRNYILALITILTLNSCGKSEKEIKIEKEKLELKIEKEKIHEQKVNVGKRKKITELTMQLQRLPEAIKKTQKNIEDIKIFKIGRLQLTKEEQLKKAYEQLSETRSYGEKLKNEIAQLEYLKTFDFQKDPESVMKYIFESAKKGDFKNFRNLCDPYGENDRDVNSICYAEILSKKRKKELEDMFKNGRIIGKPVIKENTAEIEFAFGLSSNKLEKMGMVKRNNLWYLSAF
jgi:TolA-binding protein